MPTGRSACRRAPANSITYTVHLSVRARTEAEARSVMQRYNVRVTPQGEWVVLTAPGGPVISTVTVKAPRLDYVVVSTSDGAVDASGIEGSLDVDTGAGELTADRIGGDCKLVTGGGDIRVGTVGGALRCSSGAGKIQRRHRARSRRSGNRRRRHYAPATSAARCAPKPAAAAFTLSKPAAR